MKIFSTYQHIIYELNAQCKKATNDMALLRVMHKKLKKIKRNRTSIDRLVKLIKSSTSDEDRKKYLNSLMQICEGGNNENSFNW